MNKRFCIFCGKSNISKKTKEHVIPSWLISLTGADNRQANLGITYRTGDQIKFSFDNLNFPACGECNNKYSSLESSAKEIVKKLLNHDLISGTDYNDLLNWLDKVRIGCWLGYSFLQNNVMQISPSYNINNRVAKKDRMLAVYYVNTNKHQLTLYGINTLVFQLQPSCFALLINNLLILNMSWDYMCSARCGFPYPKQSMIDHESGLMKVCNFESKSKTFFPIFRNRIIQPCMLLFQPILQSDINNEIMSLSNIYIKNHLIVDSNTMGTLFRQTRSTAYGIKNMESLINFETLDIANGWECVAQVFDLQDLSLSKNSKSLMFDNAFKRALKLNKLFKSAVRKLINNEGAL